MASALGHRLGFWNPVIYAAAQSSHSPFASLSENQVYGSQYFSQTNANGTTSPLSGSFSNNDSYYTGTPGTIFNPSTGLGYPTSRACCRSSLTEGSSVTPRSVRVGRSETPAVHRRWLTRTEPIQRLVCPGVRCAKLPGG